MAEVVAEYVDATHGLEVVAFTIEKKYIGESEFAKKPLIAFEELENIYSKENIEILVLTAFGEGSPRIRKKEKSLEIKNKGYSLFSFIDPGAYVAKSAQVGENCIVLKGVVVEPNAIIENGVFLRSESYVSHGSRIGEYSYLAPRATVAGQVIVGGFCFLGVNCTIHDRKKIGDHAIIGGGAVVAFNVPEFGVVKATPNNLMDIKSTNLNI